MSNYEKCLARINSAFEYADHRDRIDIAELILNPTSVTYRGVQVPLEEGQSAELVVAARARIDELVRTHDERVLESL